MAEGRVGPLAQDTHGAAFRERYKQVVRPLAVVVHPDGFAVGVGVGDQRGHVVEHGHGVETFGQDAEPLAGHRVVDQEAFRAPLGRCGGADTLFRGEVAALEVWTEGGQAVRHRIHQSQFHQPFQPAAQGGGGRTVEAGQLVHGGQRRGAQLQQCVLLPQAQGGSWCAAVVPGGAAGVGDYALRGLDCPGRRIQGLDALAHGAQDGLGKDAAQVAFVQEPPEGVPRDAESLHRLLATTPPGVGAHVVANGVI